MMEEMKWILQHIYNFISGLIVAFFGYLAPIKDVFLLVVASVVFDMVIGIWAARKQGKGIKSSKLWRTGNKLAIVLVIVSLTYSLDEVLKMRIELHRYVCWVVVGFEIWSILESGAKITGNKVFNFLQQFMEDKIKANTGINIKKGYGDNNSA